MLIHHRREPLGISVPEGRHDNHKSSSRHFPSLLKKHSKIRSPTNALDCTLLASSPLGFESASIPRIIRPISTAIFLGLHRISIKRANHPDSHSDNHPSEPPSSLPFSPTSSSLTKTRHLSASSSSITRAGY